MYKYVMVFGIIINVISHFKKKKYIWMYLNIALLFSSPLIFITDYKPYMDLLLIPFVFWLVYLLYLLIKKSLCNKHGGTAD